MMLTLIVAPFLLQGTPNPPALASPPRSDFLTSASYISQYLFFAHGCTGTVVGGCGQFETTVIELM